MRSRGATALIALVCLGLFVSQGCASGKSDKGASAPLADRAPSAPSAQYPADGRAAGQQADRQSPAPPPSMTHMDQESPQQGSRTLEVSRARRELDLGERELVVAGGDCRAACRALGSMDRAAGHLCELVTDDANRADRSTCEDAKATLLGARDRVRNTCGSCPGGASVERSAPIPSVP